MTELLTAAQMRAIEQAAIGSGAVTGLELMERAGGAVVGAILDWRPGLAITAHRAVVLCGPGNNGGDGFVVARLLKQRGWQVEVCLLGDPARLPPDAAKNLRRWQEEAGETALVDDTPDVRQADLCIDAVFGTGLTRAVEGRFAEALAALSETKGACPVVAVDVPSGLCADSGRVLGVAARCDLTVTFEAPRIGHLLAEGPAHCGALAVSGIGLGPWLGDAGATVRPARVESGVPGKPVGAHKYTHGHALILSGGPGHGGAARLAARGALRIGAGLVTVGCPPAALIENAARLDAIMLQSLADAATLAEAIAGRRITAACIGPGFGTGERVRVFVRTLLGSKSKGHVSGDRLPVVLDADALTEFRDDPAILFGMLHENCVLTPHEGEFGRLFPDILAKLEAPATTGPAYSRVDATREAAERAGCVVLFKGADTVIADPSGRCSVNSAHYARSAPWLATAGSGDVLSGFIAGLLARGFAPMQAAETAAWLHVDCARRFGPGLVAEDLPEQLPAVLRGFAT